MTHGRPLTRFEVSLFATPNALHQEVFYTVPRAGHVVAGPDHHTRRDHFPGHELIWCLRGRGSVRVQGRVHSVGPASLAWVNCQQPHEHWADPTDPWEVYWVRIEGPRLEAMSRMLSVADSPIFENCAAEVASLYPEVFRLMEDPAPESPALIHATVARLLALACSARARAGELGDLGTHVPEPLRKPMEQMRLFYFQQVRVSDLAAMAGLSAPHFTRLFKSVFGTSPIDWLRRERISQAKRRLVESDDSIKQIAEQVGYSDRFFFSKDFKAHTGSTPGEFRAREGKAPSIDTHGR